MNQLVPGKAKMAEISPENSSFDHSGNSLSAFWSRIILKLENMSMIIRVVKKVKISLDSSKASVRDYMSIEVPKNTKNLKS